MVCKQKKHILFQYHQERKRQGYHQHELNLIKMQWLVDLFVASSTKLECPFAEGLHVRDPYILPEIDLKRQLRSLVFSSTPSVIPHRALSSHVKRRNVPPTQPPMNQPLISIRIDLQSVLFIRHFGRMRFTFFQYSPSINRQQQNFYWIEK